MMVMMDGSDSVNLTVALNETHISVFSPESVHLYDPHDL